ncbi:MAG: hypothetical protein A2070_03010 [Bdellovibrionales bacterium GWC1_52_8]|nr:MAG: hypothetical protein A2X97_12775 [Bdellovibrionales bacterium GWA1_52_35]OFZ34348.1 MAG: hypothetical protein A2070_03010 [Bdellovibrionales bacterium GWC1_52_8]HCM41553.1 hypothetical protein [Bdellovibrionales bacterium]
MNESLKRSVWVFETVLNLTWLNRKNLVLFGIIGVLFPGGIAYLSGLSALGLQKDGIYYTASSLGVVLFSFLTWAACGIQSLSVLESKKMSITGCFLRALHRGPVFLVLFVGFLTGFWLLFHFARPTFDYLQEKIDFVYGNIALLLIIGTFAGSIFFGVFSCLRMYVGSLDAALDVRSFLRTIWDNFSYVVASGAVWLCFITILVAPFLVQEYSVTTQGLSRTGNVAGASVYCIKAAISVCLFIFSASFDAVVFWGLRNRTIKLLHN